MATTAKRRAIYAANSPAKLKAESDIIYDSKGRPHHGAQGYNEYRMYADTKYASAADLYKSPWLWGVVIVAAAALAYAVAK